MRRFNEWHRDPVRKAGHSLCWWEIKWLAFWLGGYLLCVTGPYTWSSCSLGCWRAGGVTFKWRHSTGRYTSTTPLQPSPFLLMEQHWVPSGMRLHFLCQGNHKSWTKQQPKRQESDEGCWPGKVLLVTAAPAERTPAGVMIKVLNKIFCFWTSSKAEIASTAILEIYTSAVWKKNQNNHILLPRRFLLPLWRFLLSLWSAVAGSW